MPEQATIRWEDTGMGNRDRKTLERVTIQLRDAGIGDCENWRCQDNYMNRNWVKM